MKKVLIVGSGGREHAMAWKVSQSPRVKQVFVAPGNDGMPEDWERIPINLKQGVPAFHQLAKEILRRSIDLAIIGPDDPLAAGIVDVFESYSIPTFGPTAKAARIESSKIFSKDVMHAAHVPTAEYWVTKSRAECQTLLRQLPWDTSCKGWVLKADGLALGKGVKVCETLQEALEFSEVLFSSSQFSSSSPEVLIEEKLSGEEISWMAFCDGGQCFLWDPARDYKRLLDHQQGPNTGGMGAISPIPGLPENLFERVRKEVFLPTLAELTKRGIHYRGILYAGLMWDPSTERLSVLEFNARLGDPEAQVLLPRMDSDFFEWCWAISRWDLKRLQSEHPNYRVPFSNQSVVAVVAASPGYPENPKTGVLLRFQEKRKPTEVFFSGVRQGKHGLETSGGRVFSVLGSGTNLPEARANAYQNLKNVNFDEMIFRSDIGLL